jgi:hypothetical protein
MGGWIRSGNLVISVDPTNEAAVFNYPTIRCAEPAHPLGTRFKSLQVIRGMGRGCQSRISIRFTPTTCSLLPRTLASAARLSLALTAVPDRVGSDPTVVRPFFFCHVRSSLFSLIRTSSCPAPGKQTWLILRANVRVRTVCRIIQLMTTPKLNTAGLLSGSM